ncbi:putative lipid II flippase FtsW [Alicyclobacillus sp. SO9]|uniref:putative lipid II flippase FtsW n=1 Tax=Alicyclobacillus sp. SO9 TaxID=2665646 RepID=UPI0018E75940|nr:putative lipid II flippase FtsW [Alicyclobacillus sp. SO9]QQE80368.1 putative lipid II flippase FtsW [Alicyclobacillus sp. SO9]
MDIQRHQPDYVLYFTVLILCATGIISVYSASSVWAINHQVATDYLAVKQLIAAALGTLLMTVIMLWVPYQSMYKNAVRFLLTDLFLLFVVLIPHVGHTQNGSRRWIGTGSIHIQPSEIAIVVTIIYLSYFYTRKISYLNDFKRGVRPALFIIAMQFVLIIIEPDMGTALTLLGTALTVVFASGARLRKLIIPGVIFVPAVFLAATMVHYRSQRITAWLHPFANAKTSGYQLIQGWTGIAAGGWFGKGFGMSIEKTGYLPIPQADFIFPVFTEEWGFVGALALLITFAVLVWRGFRVARHTPDRFSALLAVGITSMIVIKTLINLGAVTGLLPVTGIPLPFISYGGTSLVMDMMAMGILLNISRHALTYETDTEDLADVIPVDEARALKAESGNIDVEEEKPPREPGKTAQIHPFRPSREKKEKAPYKGSTATVRNNWRARQESSATRDSRVKRAKQSTPARGVQSTWRERSKSRSQSANTPAGGKNKRKGGKNRR